MSSPYASVPTGNGRPWLKKVLIPFWVLQILFMVFEIGVVAASLSVVHLRGAQVALFAFVIFISVTCLIFNVTEIILFANKKLMPTTYFALNLTKFLLWQVIFGLVVFSILEFGTTIAGLVINVVDELLFLGTLIYSSVIFHRHRHQYRSSAYNYQYPKPGHDVELDAAPRFMS